MSARTLSTVPGIETCATPAGGRNIKMDSIVDDIAKMLWEMDCGGRDFHNSKWNHAAAEGYERDRLWEPYYPQRLYYE